MLDDGCDCTFKKYKGEFLKGYGVIANTRNKFVLSKTDPVVIIDCENNKGVIKIVGEFLLHPSLREGDKAKFYMGKAETWKWQKHIDTNETYLMIVINGGRVTFDKYRWGP